MKPNRLLKVTDLINKRRNSVSVKLSDAFRGQEKFGQEKFSDEEVLYHVSNLKPEDVISLQEEFGLESVNEFLRGVYDTKNKMGV